MSAYVGFYGLVIYSLQVVKMELEVFIISVVFGYSVWSVFQIWIMSLEKRRIKCQLDYYKNATEMYEEILETAGVQIIKVKDEKEFEKNLLKMGGLGINPIDRGYLIRDDKKKEDGETK